MSDFLHHLWRGGSFAYYWRSSDKQSRYFATDAPLPAVTSENVYFTVYPTNVRRPSIERGRKNDVAAMNCLFAEFDCRNEHHENAEFESKEAIRAHLESRAALWPTVIVDSGGGYQAYWLLRDPHIIMDEADMQCSDVLLKTFIKAMGGDIGAADLARVLRVPGTVNSRYGNRVEIVEDWRANDVLYTLDELREWVSILTPQPAPAVIEAAPIHIEPKSVGRDASLIHAFNAASPIEATLRHYGYTLNSAGDRFTRPGKNPRDGISGTIKDGRAYTFSSSDLMFSEAGTEGRRHAFDAFDVYVKHEHAGDVKAAINALRDRVKDEVRHV